MNENQDVMSIGVMNDPVLGHVIHMDSTDPMRVHIFLRQLRTKLDQEKNPNRNIVFMADKHLGSREVSLRLLQKAVVLTNFKVVGVVGDLNQTWAQILGVPEISGKPRGSMDMQAVMMRSEKLAKLHATAPSEAASCDTLNVSNMSGVDDVRQIVERSLQRVRVVEEETYKNMGQALEAFEDGSHRMHIEQERMEQERIAHAQTQAERMEQERIAQAQVDAEKAEQERMEREQMEQERAERERMEQERIAHAQAQAARLEQERIEAERAEAARLEQERIEAERAEAERMEAERMEAERLEQERIEAERIEALLREEEEMENQRTAVVNHGNGVAMAGHKDAENVRVVVVDNVKPQRIHGRVRSGQIVTHAGDVIIEGSVHAGGEIVASGDIHVYGNAGGRLLAGVTGDMNACIYVQHFDAEMVCIAGKYHIFEDVDPSWVGKSIKISLTDHKLVFEAMEMPSMRAVA